MFFLFRERERNSKVFKCNIIKNVCSVNHLLHMVWDNPHAECKGYQYCYLDEHNPNRHRSNQQRMGSCICLVFYRKFQQRPNHMFHMLHFPHNIVLVEHNCHHRLDNNPLHRNNRICRLKYII